jgi:hypothetical protein
MLFPTTIVGSFHQQTLVNGSFGALRCAAQPLHLDDLPMWCPAFDALPAPWMQWSMTLLAVPGAQTRPRSRSVAAGRGLPRGGQGRLRQSGSNTNEER